MGLPTENRVCYPELLVPTSVLPALLRKMFQMKQDTVLFVSLQLSLMSNKYTKDF